MQPSDCLILMALNAGKIIENISHQIYFLALKFREKHFRPGLSPGPAGKAHDALLVDTLIGWGGEHHPFDISRVSNWCLARSGVLNN